jgi:UDPglucose 6-dehydrogenase
MNIAVIGSGYVGLVAGVCFAELGHDVILVDNDPVKLAALDRGEVPIHERLLPELLDRHRGKKLSFTRDTVEAARASQAIFIAVGTPPMRNGEADLSYVEAVARDLASAVHEYKVIVEKSTVPVYTSEWVRKVMLLNGASPDSFSVASNPEFLREGTAVTDFLYPDRIVIGAESERCKQIIEAIYQPLTDGDYYRLATAVPPPSDGSAKPSTLPRKIVTNARSAEMIKHASNAFLAMKISYINAVASICESVGADVEQVRIGMGSDARIGNSFLHPGIGYGGSCFPKDVSAFRSVARDSGYHFDLLDQVMRINDEQRERFLRKVRAALWNLKGKHVAVLGLAFKNGTDDIRESPAIEIVRALINEGCQVTAFDPAAMGHAAEVLPPSVQYAESPYAAVENADALLVLTEWAEFRDLDLDRIRTGLRYPIVIDGRNLFRPDDMRKRGFVYFSVGRPDVVPDGTAAGVAA